MCLRHCIPAATDTSTPRTCLPQPERGKPFPWTSWHLPCSSLNIFAAQNCPVRVSKLGRFPCSCSWRRGPMIAPTPAPPKAIQVDSESGMSCTRSFFYCCYCCCCCLLADAAAAAAVVLAVVVVVGVVIQEGPTVALRFFRYSRILVVAKTIPVFD